MQKKNNHGNDNGNGNIALIQTQHREIVKTIVNRILKFKVLIKKPIVTNYAFCTVITFSKTNSST